MESRRTFLKALAGTPILAALCFNSKVQSNSAFDAVPEQMLSPEITGNYLCQHCGNKSIFTGIDTHGYPGDDCDCGQDECICEVTLVQDFTVFEDGEIDYELFNGGYGAEIGSYNEIICRQCGKQTWCDASGVRTPLRYIFKS